MALNPVGPFANFEHLFSCFLVLVLWLSSGSSQAPLASSVAAEPALSIWTLSSFVPRPRNAVPPDLLGTVST
ncbi:hypothetical protein F4780DRAFT_70198 [Xylariomycetidae sp. FL0641]|nr:hypothetical protein F4780DRAFT_70198 [Xylariomycetidae sp. FL0641]